MRAFRQTPPSAGLKRPSLLARSRPFATWFLVADCGRCGPRARRMSDYPGRDQHAVADPRPALRGKASGHTAATVLTVTADRRETSGRLARPGAPYLSERHLGGSC